MHSVHDFSRLESILGYLSENHLADVREAYRLACEAHAGQKRHDGSPYVNHVVEVAEIIGQWHADRDTIIAALLHDVLEDAPVKKDLITQRFGRHAAMLVDGVTKFTNADLDLDLPLDRKTETLRKLFDVMRRDIRVAIIKLADRLHNIYTIDTLPSSERRKRFALETLNVYYKLASHLGMRQVRQAFADYCVPYADEEDGDRARKLRDVHCHQGELLLPSIERQLRVEDDSNALVSLMLQPRDLLKFLQRVRERMWQPSASDAYSVVVIVRDEEACYQLLKHIHTLYRPVSGQFRDYIAVPSDSGYRSLHTHVTLPDGVVIDIRLRTAQMNEQAQYGVTTFLFRGAGIGPKFSWLQRSAEIDLQTRESSGEFWGALESDILRESISVSVDRQRISVPKDSTVLDAVYALYRERAAKVQHVSIDGQSATLFHTLRPDDDVYVTLSDHELLTFDWLKYVKTKMARSMIVDVLKQRDKTEKIMLGMQLMQRELDFYKKGIVRDLPKVKQQHVAEHFRRKDFEDVITLIGEGVIRARDVVFYLYPEHGSSLFARGFGREKGSYPFRLCISGTADRQRDVLLRLNQLIQEADVNIQNTTVNFDASARTFSVFVSGNATDRLHFADFIDLLERQDWISNVQTLIPRAQRLWLIGYFVIALSIVLIDLIVFGTYQSALDDLGIVPRFFIEALPLLPIFFASSYLLRLLRQYVVRMRTDRWFLGVGFMLNVSGLLLIIMRIIFSSNGLQSLFPLMAIFILSLLYLGYTFYQADSLFSLVANQRVAPVSPNEWSAIRRRKFVGYMLRLGAVTLWGIQPLYIKYTSANEVPLSLRVFLIWLGIFLVGFLPIAVRFIGSQLRIGKAIRLQVPMTRELFGIVLGYLIFMFSFNMSLRFTTSTNVILLNSFSPVLALFIGLVFWRQTIPYLRDPKYMAWIFFAFIMGSGGGSLIVYYDLAQTGAGHALGDMFALGSMGADTLLTLSQIRYMVIAKNVSSFALSMFVSACLLILTAPLVLFSFWGNDFSSITSFALINALGVGVLTGIGQILNYETFRRIDGYIAFLMFNISILITFVIEVFFLGKAAPHWIILIGGVCVVGSTILAEAINTRCQKKGL